MTTATETQPQANAEADGSPRCAVSPGSASGYRVRFENVGACKRSWETTLKRIDFGTLYREVKKRGGIMSRGIEFCTDDDARTGSIFVGVFRCVGTFTWQNAPIRHEGAQPRSCL